MKKVSFTEMKNGTKEDYLFLDKHEKDFASKTADRILKFLSVNGMYRAIGFDGRNESYPQLTDHYFTGEYPVKPIDELGDSKITQLSLLNTAPNN